VTVGNAHNPFPRLVRAADAIAREADERVFIQYGHTNTTIEYAESVKFLSISQYESRITQSRLVVSHAGAGSVIAALSQHKPIIVVPRLHRLGEHVNDHQVEIADELSRAGYVQACHSVDNLAELALKHDFENVHHAPACPPLVSCLGEWIENVFLPRR
jgi:UDP-N-acetylglucosamine transferase subunit ALG13